jgi:hypothetical protein
MNMNNGLGIPIAITPPLHEVTPPPPLSAPEECLAYLMGKVDALGKECARLSRDLAWTQKEMDRIAKEADEEIEAVKARHREDLELLMVGGGNSERKGADPPAFGGNQRELEPWITSCRMAFANQPSKFGTERKKVLWAASFLTGLPLQAFQPILNRYLAGEDATAEVASFEGFATALRGLYGDPNLEQNSRTALRFLEQTGSVSAYYAKFVSHSQYTNLGDDALADYFYRNLHGTIKDKLAEMGPWKGLYQLKTRAIQLDSRIRERRAEKEFEAKAAGVANARRPDGRFSFQPQPRNPNPSIPPRSAPASLPQRTPLPPRPVPPPATSASDGMTPMELDAQTLAGLSNEECRRRGLCYECKQRGHKYYDCPLRVNRYSAVEIELAENDAAQE